MVFGHGQVAASLVTLDPTHEGITIGEQRTQRRTCRVVILGGILFVSVVNTGLPLAVSVGGRRAVVVAIRQSAHVTEFSAGLGGRRWTQPEPTLIT